MRINKKFKIYKIGTILNIIYRLRREEDEIKT